MLWCIWWSCPFTVTNHGGKPVVSTQHPINQRLGRVQITALHCRFSSLLQDKPRYRIISSSFWAVVPILSYETWNGPPTHTKIPYYPQFTTIWLSSNSAFHKIKVMDTWQFFFFFLKLIFFPSKYQFIWIVFNFRVNSFVKNT